MRYAIQLMRDMARLLKEVRKLDDSITHLVDCIKPVKFDTILKAVRNVAGYDHDDETF